MSIDVSCHQCGNRGRVPDHAEGCSVKCPKCNAIFQVSHFDFSESLATDSAARAARRKLWRLIKVAVLCVGVVIAVVAWHKMKLPGSGLVRLPSFQDNQFIVKGYLQKNLDDPSELEIVEMGQPQDVLIGPSPQVYDAEGVFVRAKYRAKNMFGGRGMKEAVFVIQDGKVVRSATIGAGIPSGFPYQVYFDHAVSNLGCIKRSDGKDIVP